jgi:hypothetical protein
MNEELNVQNSAGMVINESMRADLLTSAKWAKFICIIGCIAVAVMLIAGFAVMFFGNSLLAGAGLYGMQGMVGVSYIISAFLVIYPLVKGFQFANGTKAACLTNNEAELARGFAGMKGYLQFIGVLTAFVVVVYGLLLLGGGTIAAIMASH